MEYNNRRDAEMQAHTGPTAPGLTDVVQRYRSDHLQTAIITSEGLTDVEIFIHVPGRVQ